jgi:hypothetical protein
VSTRYNQSIFRINAKETSYLAVRGHATSSDMAVDQTNMDQNNLLNEWAYLLVAVLYNLVLGQAVANGHFENGPSS